MQRLTGGHAVVEQLEREGVDAAFGIPGVHNLELYDALVDGGIDHVTARHEQGVGFMADGYARTTGKVGVALVITGPGLTNVATAVGQSYSDSSPMLVISTANATNEGDRGKGLLHELKDQQGVMESIAAYSERVERVGDVPAAIADAFDYLDSHRDRPVHIEIPTDVLEREDTVSFVDRDPSSPPSPDEERLDEAAERIADAEDPVLLVGGGATGAAEAVRSFVEEVDIPVVTTVAGKGVVPANHENCLGVTVGSDAVAEFVASRDLAVAVGTELSEQETGDVAFPAELIHVDIDYTNFGKNHETALGIVGDATAAVEGLHERLAGETVGSGDPAAAVAEVAPHSLAETAADDDRHKVLSVLRQSLDDDAVVVNDMTKICYEGRNVFPMPEPGSFHFPMGYGTLGFSPPAAFGAAVGTDRQVVGLVGDGGLLFTVGDLATAVKYDIAAPILVLNDDSYDILEDVQRAQYGRTMATDIANPDFVALAESFGAAGERIPVEALDAELPAALSAAFDRDGPTVIEIPVEF
jgi:thiamine pyrophosphate-dependent acetolactate synthase large subunit-like protein